MRGHGQIQVLAHLADQRAINRTDESEREMELPLTHPAERPPRISDVGQRQGELGPGVWRRADGDEQTRGVRGRVSRGRHRFAREAGGR